VNWRIALGAGLGGLLIAPLAWLAWSSLDPPSKPDRLDESKVSPVLTPEERKSLRTYQSRCITGADCEPPLGCFRSYRYLYSHCTDSACTTDEECPEGQACRVLTTFQGPWVRKCVLLGFREEGEGCYQFPAEQDSACRPALHCAGEGWCSRPCLKGTSGSCPEGFFCAEVEPQPACLPTCEARGCPQGQECVRSEKDGASVCAVVHGHNCQRAPCPLGSSCEDSLVPSRPGEAWVYCVQHCGKPETPPCPADHVCYFDDCERTCSPEKPGACGEGFHCVKMPKGGPWLCKPEWYRPRE
jgi:hypothetical protein